MPDLSPRASFQWLSARLCDPALRWPRRRIDIIGIVILVFLFFRYTGAYRPSAYFDPGQQVDFGLVYDYVAGIFRTLHYPSPASGNIFPYSPGAVGLLLPLTALPRPVAFGLWLVLLGASLGVVSWIALRFAGASRWHYRVLIPIAALVLADNSMGWDLKNKNNNLVSLALVMLALLARKDWLGGLPLAASLNLKLYSVFLIPGLLWRREYGLAGATIVMSLLIGVVVPMAIFGIPGFIQLWFDWLDQLRYTNSLAGYLSAAPLVTLRHAAVTILQSDPDATGVLLLWRGTQALWVALVVAYFLLVGRTRRGERDDVARLADACVLLMAPLPLSHWLEPYHLVVVFPALILLVATAFNDESSVKLRLLAAATALGAGLSIKMIPAFELRGAAVLLSLVLILTGLCAIRLARMKAPSHDRAKPSAGEPHLVR
jgi:hypothetical protein